MDVSQGWMDGWMDVLHRARKERQAAGTTTYCALVATKSAISMCTAITAAHPSAATMYTRTRSQCIHVVLCCNLSDGPHIAA
jgi:hypothetical protein